MPGVASVFLAAVHPERVASLTRSGEMFGREPIEYLG
jgi:hypothetical protein